jgi:hypothetical protein
MVSREKTATVLQGLSASDRYADEVTVIYTPGHKWWLGNYRIEYNGILFIKNRSNSKLQPQP